MRPAPVTRSPAAVDLDPPDAVVRFGLVALATDLTTERDAARVLPHDRAALHVARVAYENPTTPENLRRMAPRLTEAASLIAPDTALSAILYGCTSASVVIGDDAVIQAIQAARPGVPVVTPTSAAMDAFSALGVRRIAMLTPYLPETTAPMVTYFADRGLGIVAADCLGLEDDREMARLRADTLIAAAEAADRTEAEALFIACTAVPALGVIEAIEARLGKPVISANQASLWRMLAHAGLPAAPAAPGRLFAHLPLERAA